MELSWSRQCRFQARPPFSPLLNLLARFLTITGLERDAGYEIYFLRRNIHERHGAHAEPGSRVPPAPATAAQEAGEKVGGALLSITDIFSFVTFGWLSEVAVRPDYDDSHSRIVCLVRIFTS